MAILQLLPNFGANRETVSMGAIVAPWYATSLIEFQNKISNKANWWGDGATANFFYSIKDGEIYTQYGQDTGEFASARFFSENFSYVEGEQLSDGSVQATVTITVGLVGGGRTTHAQAGWDVVHKLKVNGQTLLTYTGNSIDEYTQAPSPTTITFDVTIPPESYSSEAMLTFNAHYPNGETTDNTANIGLTLYNPTPPVYVPMAERKSGKWKNLNDNGGKIQIRKSGKWVDRSKENSGTSLGANKGHNRIRKSDTWKQLPKMTNN